MVEDLLVGNSLTSEMIESGEKLIIALDKGNFSIKGAFWLYLPGDHQWLLILAMPEVNNRGPKKAYKKLQPILDKMPDLKLTLLDIKILDSTDGFINLLKTALKTGNDIVGIRFTRNTINGVLIDDAYIYRLI